MVISKFWSGDFEKKIGVGEGLVTLQFFGHLKRAVELLISFRMWSLFWQKMQNSTFLLIGAWNFHSKVLWYAESDDVIFIKILCLLWGVSPFFQKPGKFSQARNFWLVRLNLMKLIYLNQHKNPILMMYLLVSSIIVSVTIEPGRSLLLVRYHELFD